LLPVPAEDLPLDDASVDAVVVTLVLCTVPEPARALAEIQRVLAPGGRLLVLEHVRAEDPRLARRQDLVRPLQQLVARGCHPNRDTLGLLERAPLRLERVERFALPGAPAHLRPAIEVVATKA
jgi:ubiquinone/menaquinone biosynthesis C-methylase UbiE